MSVCVKASPEGRRFHRNTVYARLRVSTGVHVEHPPPSAGDVPHEDLGRKAVFCWGLGLRWVFSPRGHEKLRTLTNDTHYDGAGSTKPVIAQHLLGFGGMGFGVWVWGSGFERTNQKKMKKTQKKKKTKKKKIARRKNQKKRNERANTMCSTSANFDFGRFQFRPISISADFNFGRFQFRPISISANFNFGQFQFRPISISGQFQFRPISISANFNFGQFHFRPISFSANFIFGQFHFRPVRRARRRVGSRFVGPRRDGAPNGGGP